MVRAQLENKSISAVLTVESTLPAVYISFVDSFLEEEKDIL